MFKPKTFRLDAGSLVEDLEIFYQELRDEMGLEFKKPSRLILSSLLTFAVEDALNKRTSNKFRTSEELLLNFIKNYLENECSIYETDDELINEVIVEPIMEETSLLLRNLLKNYDNYYSIWEVEAKNDLDFVNVSYLGDHRIKEWHLIQKVRSSAEVVVKQHRIRLDVLRNVIFNAFDSTEYAEELAINDYPVLMTAIFDYFINDQKEEFYNELIATIKKVNGDEGRRTGSSKASKITRSIITALTSIRSFAAFVEDVKIAERSYYYFTRHRIIMDLVMPSKTPDVSESRKEILEILERVGYVDKETISKVEIVYG